MGGESGSSDRVGRLPLGRQRAEASGGACPERAGCAAARGIRLTQLVSAPQNPDLWGGGGEGGKRVRTRVRSGAGRSRDLAAG